MNLLTVKQKAYAILTQREVRKYEKFWYNSFLDELYRQCKDIKRLSAAQQAEASAYYRRHFGRDVPPVWHEYYYSMTGEFHPEIVPDCVFYPHVLPFLNDLKIERGYLDKNNYERLFPHMLQPRSIVKNINGFFYREGRPVTREEAEAACADLPDAIIKPTLDTFQGWNVRRWTSHGGKTDVGGRSVSELFGLYRKNFIVQETLRQHAVMASLNPTSINTIRIVTLRMGNDIIPLSSIVRVGRKGSVVDNGHSGGYCCGIGDDGRLKEKAYICTSGECRETSDNGTRFGSIRVPRFRDIVAQAQELHLTLPYIRLIGWDFCLNDREETELIEFNSTPSIDIMQLCNGPVLGKYTENILKECSKNRYQLKIGYELISK